MNDRIKQLERQVAQLTAQLASLIPVRNTGGGGGGANNATTFAKVTVQANSNGGSIGKCVLLDEDMQPLNAAGDPLEGSPTDDDLVEFKSADFLDAQVDKRVILHSQEAIAAGDTWDDNKVWGTLVEYPSTEELTCSTITFVTDVACVDDEIVVTTDDVEVVTGPCP